MIFVPKRLQHGGLWEVILVIYAEFHKLFIMVIKDLAARFGGARKHVYPNGFLGMPGARNRLPETLCL